MTTHDPRSWRAGCEETRTSGSAGGGEKTTGRKADTAPAAGPTQKPRQAELPQLALLGDVQQANTPMFRAFLLNEELKFLYALEDPALAPAHLDAWLGWATRSRLAPFVKLACTIRRHRNGILAAIQLELSNGRLNGLNSRIRLISHRSFGLSRARVQPSETLVVERKQVVTAELVRRSRLVQRGMPRRPSGPPEISCEGGIALAARGLLRQELVGPQRTKVQDRYPLLSTSHLIPHRRLS
jgi:hypothetical protein